MVFKAYLTKKQISIDVADEDDGEPSSAGTVSEKMQKTAETVIEGLGGFDNIVTVNNCITRLRVDVKDMGKIDEDLLRKTGSLGIFKVSDTHIQVVYGPKVEQVADAVRHVIKNY